MTEIDLNLLEREKKDDAMALMGLNLVSVENDKLVLTVTVQEKHLNAHGVCHGGVLYMICNQAVAAYDAAIGRNGVGMDGSIHYYRPARKGDTLKAIVANRKMGRRSGTHFVELIDQDGKLVAESVFTSMYLD